MYNNDVKFKKHKKWSFLELKEYIEEYYREFDLLTSESEYININSFAVLKHKNADTIIKKTFRTLLLNIEKKNNNVCDIDYRYSNIKEMAKENNVELLSQEQENIKYDTMLEIRCSCGANFKRRAYDFIKKKNTQCNSRHDNPIWDRDSIIKYVKKNIPEISLSPNNKEHITSKTKIEWECNCGNTFYSTFINLCKGHKKPRCNECSYKDMIENRNQTKTTYNYIKEYIEQNNDNGCKLETPFLEYMTVTTKIRIKCKCGEVFETTFEKFKKRNKRQCNNCSSKSIGEDKIRKILSQKNIFFKEQFTFPDCKDKKLLPFDFAIFNDKGKRELKCLIEYDGKQHYKPSYGFTSNQKKNYDNFIYLLNHDLIKNNYCIDNNIKLIRIPYYCFNKLYDIIENKLNNI